MTYNTRKGIRQRVATFFATFATCLQPVCNLSKTHINKPKTLIPCGFTACIFYVCNLCNLFSMVLVYIENFFYFFIFQHNPQKQVAKVANINMHLRNRIAAGFSALVHKILKVANGLQTGCKGCKKGCKGCNIVRIPFVQHKKGDTSKGCKKVAKVAILSGFLSYNTRKGIRQRL